MRLINFDGSKTNVSTCQFAPAVYSLDRQSARKWLRPVGSIALTLVLFSLPQAFAAGRFYTGACSSQGDWVNAAMSHIESIRQSIDNLKNDPACQGIETVVQQMKIDDMREAANRKNSFVDLISINREMKDLRQMYGQGSAEFRGKVVDNLVGKLIQSAESQAEGNQSLQRSEIDNATNSVRTVTARGAQALDVMMDGVSKSLDVMPNFRACFNKQPNQAAAIIAGLVKVGAAFVDGGEGVGSRLGTLIAKIVTFARNDAYAAITAHIQEQEFLTAMSCLVETSAQAYCEATDAYHLVADQQKLVEQIRSDRAKNQSTANPLRGYYLLTRELPKIGTWLQRVVNGVPPKMVAQADFLNGVNESLNKLIQNKNSLEAIYSNAMSNYRQNFSGEKSDAGLDAKRTYVINNFLVPLIAGMYGGRNYSVGVTSVNFFQVTMPEQIAPFFLLGQGLPGEFKNTAVQQVVWSSYLANNMETYVGLSNPDSLIVDMKPRLERLIADALDSGNRYFTYWYIPDPTLIVDEALASSPPSVYQSLLNLDSYLSESLVRLDKVSSVRLPAIRQELAAVQVDSLLTESQRRQKSAELQTKIDFYSGPGTYNSILETQHKIRKLLQSFEGRVNFKDKVATKLWNQIGPQIKPHGDILSEKSREMDLKILQTAYDEFNMILQRETFLFMRLSNYVLYEYMDRVQSGEDVSAYMKELLAVTGNNLIDKLIAINRVDPNATLMSLHQAQPINHINLEGVEQLLSDNFKRAICDITYRIGGNAKNIDGCKKVIGQRSDAKICSLYQMVLGKCIPKLTDLTNSLRGSKEVLRADTEFKSFEQLRAKYCMQTMSFPTRWNQFTEICDGTTVNSQYEREAKLDGIQVNFSYNNYVSSYAKPEKTGTRICALRDYMRRNHVYWLLSKQVY